MFVCILISISVRVFFQEFRAKTDVARARELIARISWKKTLTEIEIKVQTNKKVKVRAYILANSKERKEYVHEVGKLYLNWKYYWE